jgi:hypothetical protein
MAKTTSAGGAVLMFLSPPTTTAGLSQDVDPSSILGVALATPDLEYFAVAIQASPNVTEFASNSSTAYTAYAPTNAVRDRSGKGCDRQRAGPAAMQPGIA